MARPCGCAGECGCTVVGIDGIRTSGSGTVRDPILVGLNNPLGGNGCEAVLDCVGGALANGLSYNDTLGQISTRLSGDADNNIIYGSDGGLYATGEGGGGGDGGVTVASLPATNLIGGLYGAGYAHFPEATLWPYEAAMDIEDIQFIHVPVRRIGDGMPVAQHRRIMSDYTLASFGLTTLDFDLHMYKRIVVKPSGSIFPDETYDALAGYFGAAHPDTGVRGGHGGLLLSDVFRITGRRKVLVLQCKDVGSTVGDTLLPDTTFQLMDNLVRQWGMTQGIIAGSEIPSTASAGEKASIVQGMLRFKNAGAATAMFFADATQLAAYPPATLATLYGDGTGPGWVFLNYELAEANPANATAYRDAGFQVILTGAHRQYHYELQRTLGLRGIDCADPVYAAGFKSAFRYRRMDAEWTWPTPDWGRHAYRTQNITTPTWERGYTDSGKLFIEQFSLVNPATSPDFQRTGYMVLAGEQCPIADPTWDPDVPGDYGEPTNYDIEVGFSWSRLMSDRSRWMSVFFGVPEDRPLSEWVYTNEFTKGYQFQLNQNGLFTMQRYDGIPWTGSLDPVGPWPYQFSSSWASSWGTINPDQEYRILIQVRPGTVTMGRLGPGSTVLNGMTFTNTDVGGRGERWRGPYFYLGRHFWQASDGASCRFHNLKTRVYP